MSIWDIPTTELWHCHSYNLLYLAPKKMQLVVNVWDMWLECLNFLLTGLDLKIVKPDPSKLKRVFVLFNDTLSQMLSILLSL